MNVSQAGLHCSWWERAAEHHCFARNAAGEEIAFYRRYLTHPKHPLIPFGALVDFMPSPVGLDREPFDSKTVPGIFVGYHEQPGGWHNGDFYVAEFPPFQSNPDAEPQDVRVHRIKEVVDLGKVGPLCFPLADFRRKKARVIPEVPPEAPTASGDGTPEVFCGVPQDPPPVPEPAPDVPVDSRGEGA